MTENGAKAVKIGGVILSVAVPIGVIVKKHGRRIIKAVKKVGKIR